MSGPVGQLPLALTPENVAEQLSCSRAHVYREMKAGTLPSLLVGSHRRVLYSDLCAYLERLRAEEPTTKESRAVQRGEGVASLDIRIAREQLGMSLKSLAMLADVSVAHLSRIELGLDVPSLPAFARIALELGRPDIADLLRPYSKRTRRAPNTKRTVGGTLGGNALTMRNDVAQPSPIPEDA